jgi:hypothetical protein
MFSIYQRYCRKFESTLLEDDGTLPSPTHNLDSPAHFLTIYIEEARPGDAWFMPIPGYLAVLKKEDKSAKDTIKQHKTLEDRLKAARRFITENKFPIETVINLAFVIIIFVLIL